MKKSTLLLFLAISPLLLFAQGSPTFTGTIAQIRALTGTTYLQAASTNYGTGNWYLDTTDVTSADNTATVLVDADGKRWKRIYSGPIYVNWYGAVGDGVTDNTTAIQACFNAAVPFETIAFSAGTYNFTSATITSTDFIITGNKANLLGTLIVGNSTSREYHGVITGLTFSTSHNAIELNNCQKLEITSNVFNNCDTAILVEPSTVGVHSSGKIEITKANYFNNTNYCFYVRRAPTASWESTNDCTFSGNVASTLITTVYCDGIDGLKYQNNTVFMPSDPVRRVNKKHHLQLDTQADWVIVSGNNLFESGEESILVNNCANLNINSNNFAWSGQDSIYNVIKATGTITSFVINVTGNDVNGFSGNFVQIDPTTYGALNVSGNNINYSDTFPDYFGPPVLNTFDHYIVRAYNALTRVFEKDYYNNVINLKSTNKASFVTKYEVWGSFGSESYAFASVLAVDTVTALPVVGLYDSGILSSTFGGTLNITVKDSTGSGSGANTSNYLLMVNKASTGSATVYSTISKLGLLTGSAASWPSFTFTAVGNKLYATAIHNTRGRFYFYVKSDGNLTVTQ